MYKIRNTTSVSELEVKQSLAELAMLVVAPPFVVGKLASVLAFALVDTASAAAFAVVAFVVAFVTSEVGIARLLQHRLACIRQLDIRQLGNHHWQRNHHWPQIHR